MTRRNREVEADYVKAIWDASPDGRLARLEAVLQQMLDCGEDPDEMFYRRRVAGARAAIEQRKMAEALVHLAKAEHALTELDFIADKDRLRGQKTLRAASEGGLSRAATQQQVGQSVIAEMEKLLAGSPEKGVVWAAKMAHKRGVGTSLGANRAIWYRRR